MQAAGGAVGRHHLRERHQNAALVAGVSAKAGIGQGLKEVAAIRRGSLEGPENISVGHGSDCRYGWVHDA